MVVISLAGGTTNFELEIFNNSGKNLVFDTVKEITLEQDASGIVKIYTSTKKLRIVSNSETYDYQIELSSIPGKYIIPRVTHRIELQVEKDMRIYVQQPESELPISSVISQVQPNGFPMVPTI